MEDSEGRRKELAQFSGTNDGHYGKQGEERRSGNEDEAVALPFLASQLILRAARILYRFLSEPPFRPDAFHDAFEESGGGDISREASFAFDIRGLGCFAGNEPSRPPN